MSNNPQVGGGLIVRGAPYFKNFVVIDGTFKVKPALKVLQTRDGNSNVYNYTGWSPGDEAQADWNIKMGARPASTLDIITESFLVVFSGQPTAGQTLIVGTVAYDFVAALTDPANQVLIGANLQATIANLVGAILASDTGGQAAGTTYGTGTVANPAATGAIDLTLGFGVKLDQITPWGPANALSVSGTCTVASINNCAITAGVHVARSFVIPEAPDTSEFGGKPLKQSVKLNYHADGFVPVAVT